MDEEKNDSIRKMDVSKIAIENPYATIGIIGDRKTGKTTIIHELCDGYHKYNRNVVLVSGSAQQQGSFNGIIPNVLIYENYDPKVVAKMISKQGVLCKEYKDNPYVKKQGLVILDDITGTEAIWKKDKTFTYIMTQGRHAFMGFVISVQFPREIPPDIRSNFEYVIVTNLSTEAKQKFFYDNYLDHRYFPTMEKFLEVYRAITKEPYKFMIIRMKGRPDTEEPSTENKLSDYVFWGKCANPRGKKYRRLAHPDFWKMDEKYYDPEYMFNSNGVMSGAKRNIKLVD